jgi:nucleoside 2-deoxyribosyltransferase
MTEPESQVSKVYLAGPGVFRRDAKLYGASLREKCQRSGLVGCFPLDNEISDDVPKQMALNIYSANIEMINSSRAIVADISPFSGPNMDPGTAWEIGYGIARGLPIFAWTADLTVLVDRTQRYEGHHNSVDKNGCTIENFGLVENLMIANSCVSLHDTEDAAIAACAAHLLVRDEQSRNSPIES